MYPPENRKLADEVSARGALISEFPLLAPPVRAHFPRRNRVIAGMSLAVCVVEAARRSGSLITASYALDENREVCAVPGPARAESSAGTHALIKEGARLVESAADILEAIHVPKPAASVRTHSGAGEMLSEREQALFSLLGSKPVYIDELAQRSGLTLQAIMPALLTLELKEMIEGLPGNYFMARNSH